MSNAKHLRFVLVAGLSSAAFFANHSAALAASPSLEDLQKIIQQQQKQIEAQSKAIQQLNQKIDHLSAREPQVMPAANTQRGSRTQPTQRSATPAPASPPSKAVESGNEKVKVSLTGQINRGVLFTDDGPNENVFHVDNDHSSTRFNIKATGDVSKDVTLGAEAEVQFESNSTGSVNQTADNGVGPNNFTERKLQVFVASKQLGKVTLGQGSLASDSSAQQDVSGTSVIAYSKSAQELAGGVFFVNSATNAFGPTIKSVFNNFDGLSRDDRIRYDTPRLYGFSAATSHASGGDYDFALTYKNKLGPFKIAAAAAAANQQRTSSSVDWQYSGSASVLHDSGINLTVSGGYQDMRRNITRVPRSYYVKLGYRAKWFDIGSTDFAIDFGRALDISMSGDRAKNYGLGIVQNLSDWGTQFYFGARNHKLDRRGTSFDDVFAILSGARVKF